MKKKIFSVMLSGNWKKKIFIFFCEKVKNFSSEYNDLEIFFNAARSIFFKLLLRVKL